jgi:hypothetical protein
MMDDSDLVTNHKVFYYVVNTDVVKEMKISARPGFVGNNVLSI